MKFVLPLSVLASTGGSCFSSAVLSHLSVIVLLSVFRISTGLLFFFFLRHVSKLCGHVNWERQLGGGMQFYTTTEEERAHLCNLRDAYANSMCKHFFTCYSLSLSPYKYTMHRFSKQR